MRQEAAAPLPPPCDHTWPKVSIKRTPACRAQEEESFSECDEVLVVDGRAAVGPAQQVEDKLSTLLGGAAAGQPRPHDGPARQPDALLTVARAAERKRGAAILSLPHHDVHNAPAEKQQRAY